MRQYFIIVDRAPEAAPIHPLRIRRLIQKDRPDSEWEVREVYLKDGKILDTRLKPKGE